MSEKLLASRTGVEIPAGQHYPVAARCEPQRASSLHETFWGTLTDNGRGYSLRAFLLRILGWIRTLIAEGEAELTLLCSVGFLQPFQELD